MVKHFSNKFIFSNHFPDTLLDSPPPKKVIVNISADIS